MICGIETFLDLRRSWGLSIACYWTVVCGKIKFLHVNQGQVFVSGQITVKYLATRVLVARFFRENFVSKMFVLTRSNES